MVGPSNSTIGWLNYDFCRIHKTLRVTPAMESKLTDHIWELSELFGTCQNCSPRVSCGTKAPWTILKADRVETRNADLELRCSLVSDSVLIVQP